MEKGKGNEEYLQTYMLMRNRSAYLDVEFMFNHLKPKNTNAVCARAYSSRSWARHMVSDTENGVVNYVDLHNQATFSKLEQTFMIHNVNTVNSIKGK